MLAGLLLGGRLAEALGLAALLKLAAAEGVPVAEGGLDWEGRAAPVGLPAGLLLLDTLRAGLSVPAAPVRVSVAELVLVRLARGVAEVQPLRELEAVALGQRLGRGLRLLLPLVEGLRVERGEAEAVALARGEALVLPLTDRLPLSLLLPLPLALALELGPWPDTGRRRSSRKSKGDIGSRRAAGWGG